MNLIYLLLPAILLIPQHAPAQNTIDKDLTQKLDQVMTDNFDKDALGGVLLVAKHGTIIYNKAVGKANMELNIPLAATNVFRIGSITKQFTSVAILQLMEKGLLQLDDDITKFIPDYPVHGYHISIANLLSHTSGIKNCTDIENPDIRRRKNTPLNVIDMFKDQPMDFAPGAEYRYSNSNYILLGYIIEKLSGQSYEEYIRDHIFIPLGMTHSYYDTPEKIIPGRITGYVQTGPNTAVNADYLDPSFAYSAGALIMTAEDLFKWHTGLYKYSILKKASLDKALTPFTLTNGQQTKYGFGWQVDSLFGTPVIQHSGSINGFSAFEFYMPKEDVFAVCFSNRININTGGPAVLAASITAGRPETQEIRPSEQQIARYIGTYKFRLDQPASIKIFMKNGKPFFRDSNAPSDWEMHFTTPTEFYMYEVFPNNHIFSIDSSGKVTGFNIHGPHFSAPVTRVE